jgi:hypothetical protein
MMLIIFLTDKILAIYGDVCNLISHIIRFIEDKPLIVIEVHNDLIHRDNDFKRRLSMV